jgi:hypothetical protein
MNKDYIIGGLAVVGAVALIAYFSKSEKNSLNFLNAIGEENLEETDLEETDLEETDLEETDLEEMNMDGFAQASGGMVSGSSSKKAYGFRCRRPNGTFYSTQAGQGYCTYSSDTIVSYGE